MQASSFSTVLRVPETALHASVTSVVALWFPSSESQLTAELDQPGNHQPRREISRRLSPQRAVVVVRDQNGTVVQHVVDVEIRSQARPGADRQDFGQP